MESIDKTTPDLLRSFANALGQAGPNEDAICKAAAISCIKILQAMQCSVWLVDEMQEKLIIRYAKGYSKLQENTHLEYPLKSRDGKPIGITAWIYENQKEVSAKCYTELKGKPCYSGNFDAELHGYSEQSSKDEDHPCQQFYGGPISLGETRFGVLKVENKISEEEMTEALEFSNADRATLDTVAAMLAMALKHARAANKSQKQRALIPTQLREFATALIAAGLNEKDLLEKAVSSCIKILQARQCSVWLVDEMQEKLIIRYAKGYSKLQDNTHLEYPLKSRDGKPIGITAWIYENQKEVNAKCYTELKGKPGYSGNFDAELHGHSEQSSKDEDHPCQQFYGGPISLGKTRFGVLKVENKVSSDDTNDFLEFSDADQAALDTVAAMLALALEHARTGAKEMAELAKYHEYTIHSMRNEIMPVEIGLQQLRKLSESGHEQCAIKNEEFQAPLQLLSMGTQNLQFYLENILKYLHPVIDQEHMESIQIKKILNDEVWLLSQIASDQLDAKFTESNAAKICVHGDEGFIAATVKELLRNARKAIYRRRENEKRNSLSLTRGKVDVAIKIDAASSMVIISISDNGDATIDKDAYEYLSKAWKQAKAKNTHEIASKVGLNFIQWVVEKHDGSIDLIQEKDITKFQVSIPLDSILNG